MIQLKSGNFFDHWGFENSIKSCLVTILIFIHFTNTSLLHLNLIRQPKLTQYYIIIFQHFKPPTIPLYFLVKCLFVMLRRVFGP